MKRIAILASGEGTNAENIISKLPQFDFTIYSNNPSANVLQRANNLKVNYGIFSNINALCLDKFDLIVLAGYLRLIPKELTKKYKIINIHPSLLPKYGGKGMYGMKVHQAVYDAKEKETGITIHWVNEYFDQGEIIYQHRIKIDDTDTPETIQGKVHQLELRHYPEVIMHKLHNDLIA